MQVPLWVSQFQGGWESITHDERSECGNSYRNLQIIDELNMKKALWK
jgi:hypothetical protein